MVDRSMPDAAVPMASAGAACARAITATNRRRLPRAVRPEQSEDGSGVHAQIEAVEGARPVERLDQLTAKKRRRRHLELVRVLSDGDDAAGDDGLNVEGPRAGDERIAFRTRI